MVFDKIFWEQDFYPVKGVKKSKSEVFIIRRGGV